MDTQPAEIQPSRLPFDAEFFKQAGDFSTAVMTAIPELHGVAIIPLWNTQPENSPPGILRLRNPQPPFIHSLFKLINRLTAFSMAGHQDLINQMKMFDQHAADLAAQINARTEQLAQLDAQPGTTNANG